MTDLIDRIDSALRLDTPLLYANQTILLEEAKAELLWLREPVVVGDLIERLREAAQPPTKLDSGTHTLQIEHEVSYGSLYREAADELERQARYFPLSELTSRDAELSRLRAEVAALRAVLVELVSAEDVYMRALRISPIEPGCEREVLRDEAYAMRHRGLNAARALTEKKT